MKDNTQHMPLFGDKSILTTHDSQPTSAERVEPSVQKKLNKRVSQSNHDPYIIPTFLSQYADEPLYLLVALWCKAQARWVDRNDIAAAFHLTARRASYQMSYISCKKQCISSRIRHVAYEDQRRRRSELYVESVTLTKESMSPKKTASTHMVSSGQNVMTYPPKKGGRRSSRVGNGGRDNPALWRWLLSRPSGEDK
ncbi:CaiF/GrlA family transcriptional regulator [Hafnia paralvei]|nr:CaiF/GrlA family transcriptional regulator [Hafnia paralvei]